MSSGRARNIKKVNQYLNKCVHECNKDCPSKSTN